MDTDSWLMYEAYTESLDQLAGFGDYRYGKFKFKISDLIKVAEKYPIEKVSLREIQNTETFKNIPSDTQKGSKERIKKANYTKYPVSLVIDNNGIVAIADGTHRIRAAIRDKQEYIAARKIPVQAMNVFKLN